MENVIYSREVRTRERGVEYQDGEAPRIYLTGESNGWAIWLTLENQVHLIGFFIPRFRERAIEEVVRHSIRPLSELLKEAITQVHP
jgi:hypothetical protein